MPPKTSGVIIATNHNQPGRVLPEPWPPVLPVIVSLPILRIGALCLPPSRRISALERAQMNQNLRSRRNLRQRGATHTWPDGRISPRFAAAQFLAAVARLLAGLRHALDPFLAGARSVARIGGAEIEALEIAVACTRAGVPRSLRQHGLGRQQPDGDDRREGDSNHTHGHEPTPFDQRHGQCDDPSMEAVQSQVRLGWPPCPPTHAWPDENPKRILICTEDLQNRRSATGAFKELAGGPSGPMRRPARATSSNSLMRCASIGASVGGANGDGNWKYNRMAVVENKMRITSLVIAQDASENDLARLTVMAKTTSYWDRSGWIGFAQTRGWQP